MSNFEITFTFCSPIGKEKMSLNEAVIAEKHVITHNGYRFSKMKKSKKCVSYWCVCNRSSKSKCTAKMKMDLTNIEVLEESGDHDESCSWKSAKGRPLKHITNIPEGGKINRLH